MKALTTYIENHKNRFIDELVELLKIPSVSADSAYNQDVLNTAEFVKKSLEKALLNNVTIHIDSFEELTIIEKLILVNGYDANIGIRVNIDIENRNRSRFGIDHQSKEFKNIISLILTSHQKILRS